MVAVQARGDSAEVQEQAAMSDPAEGTHHRDAAHTRKRLLDAALRRFAHAGYTNTTVREIARDAGVDAALINRYFQSKEGLFRACLAWNADHLLESTNDVVELSQIPEIFGGVMLDAVPGEGLADAMLLLLRSSGDERAEQMRTGMLIEFSESLASIGGWAPGRPDEDDLLLRSQLVIAMGLGVAALKTSGVEPMASVSRDRLIRPLRQLVEAMLGSGCDAP